MSKRTYDDLKSKLDLLLEIFEVFIRTPDDDNHDNEVLLLVNVVKRSGTEIEFKIANRTFVLNGEILTSQKTVLLRTFEIVSKIGSANQSSYSHYTDIDIVVSSFETRFVKLIARLPNHDFRKPDPTIIENFGEQYLEQLWTSIEKLEKQRMPLLEEIPKR